MRPVRAIGRLLAALVRVAIRRPGLTLAVGAALAVVALAYAVSALTFRTSNLDLLPPHERYVTLYRHYSDVFGGLDDILVVVEAPTPDEAKAYAARLDGAIQRGPIRFPRVAYRVDPKGFAGRELLYLSAEDLVRLRDAVVDHRAFIESFAASPTLSRLLNAVDREVGAAFVTNFLDLGVGDTTAQTDVRFLRVLLSDLSARIERGTPYRSPWSSVFTVDPAGDDDSYFFSKDKKLLYVLISPPERRGGFTRYRGAIAELRRTVAALRHDFPRVRAGVTGEPVLSNDEMTAASRDSAIATVLAMALTLGLLFLAFRRVGKPVAMLAVLALSVAWSLGLVTLVIGHLTIFSIMFVPIVIGLGTDYGIYVLFRYDEERARGYRPGAALALAAERSGPGILLGALTAALTFYVLTLTDFRGIREFGFVAGTALVMALLAMLTIFPAVLTLADRRHDRPRRVVSGRGIREVPLVRRIARRPVPVLAGAAVLTALALGAVHAVGFDYNLLHLQAKGTESVTWEEKIVRTEQRSSFSALASATSFAELRRKADAFAALPTVSRVDSALDLVPERQDEKRAIIGTLRPVLAPLRPSVPPPLDLDALIASLRSVARRFDLAVREAGPGGTSEDVRAVQAGAHAVLAQLERRDRAAVVPAVASWERALAADFRAKLATLQKSLDPRPVGLADLPADVRRNFVAEDGLLLLQIQPKVDIWRQADARRFVDQLRSVDRDVTGAPVVTYEALRSMESAYREGTLYAVLLVIALTVGTIWRLRESALALVPLLLGTLWAFGLMPVLGLEFNLANVWGLPLIIGASAEFGVNLVLRSLDARAHGGPPLPRSTVLAVLLNGLTTLAGFASLLVAHHYGIWSLGMLLVLGSATSLAASLLVLPVLIRLATPKPEEEIVTGRAA